ncbi:putative DNA excision repair protein [Calycina marina]|uniref:DNA excision repair protein n=1 Tax=Calycina marina TaxID=1763456 RepID=A0A9P8CB76_9HELO|nr:putative DNA excision repair protein [Calycina marina]
MEIATMGNARRSVVVDDIDDDEDTMVARYGQGRRLTTTDKYIDKVFGQISGSGSDVEIIEPTSNSEKDQKPKHPVSDSSDEEGGGKAAYEDFKNRHKIKQRKASDYKKKLMEKAKKAAGERKKAKENGEEKRERVWDTSDIEGDETVPEYFIERRKTFDRKHEKLHKASLRLPPRYDDIEFSDDERLADLDERPNLPFKLSRPYKNLELPHSAGIVPASIARYLRDYQVEGAAFLHELFVYQKGGILGDDMGLGKTVQTAAFLAAAFGKTGDQRDIKRMRKTRRNKPKEWYPRVLIICPSSLMDNWENELNRWGFWHIQQCHGSGRGKVLETARSGRLEVMITTYGTYKIALDEVNSVDWDCVIADECHMIKERSSAVTQSMNAINALCRIGLTGTAIQNKYEELWTLLNWTNPGQFGPISTWITSICKPLRQGQSHDATVYQLKQARLTAKKLVQNLLPQFFLRRMKTLIAHQLPKKTDRVVFCQLTDTQQKAYELFLNSVWVEIVRTAHEECDCASGKKRGTCCYAKLPDGSKWQALVFPLMSTLQKLSSHLALLIPNALDRSDKQERALVFLQQMIPDRWKELYAKRDSLMTSANPDFCGKWVILKKLLKYWHNNGDKVLVFSHSVKLLKMLETMFKNTSYNVSLLSGEVKPSNRQGIVDAYNNDPGSFVFLISTKVGGVGLNITSANKIVIFDPNWNPSYDLQAQDRAYRIGQQRDVEVFRLISAGTIEEVVYARQIYKQQQANIGYNASTERRYFKGVQEDSTQKGEIFGLDNLLSFHRDNILLRDIVNKTNIAEAKRGISIMDIDMEEALNDDDNPLKIDDDSDEDGAMSQLVALITEGKVKKKKKAKLKADPVLAILASAGVEYTHENSEVVGSSRVEAHLSRQAEETGNDVEMGDARMFSESGPAAVTGGVEYKFYPSEEVMMRQFCTMAKTFGFASATEFALVVETWTHKQRTDCLERFYMKRKERLAELDNEGEDKVKSEEALSFALDNEVINLDSDDGDDEL